MSAIGCAGTINGVKFEVLRGVNTPTYGTVLKRQVTIWIRQKVALTANPQRVPGTEARGTTTSG
jgi:hypothetical protein